MKEGDVRCLACGWRPGKYKRAYTPPAECSPVVFQSFLNVCRLRKNALHVEKRGGKRLRGALRNVDKQVNARSAFSTYVQTIFQQFSRRLPAPQTLRTSCVQRLLNVCRLRQNPPNVFEASQFRGHARDAFSTSSASAVAHQAFLPTCC